MARALAPLLVTAAMIVAVVGGIDGAGSRPGREVSSGR